MGKMVLQSCVLGPVSTNVYFVMNADTKELLIVDPSYAAERIVQKIDQMGGRPVAILLTHGHSDHIMAAGKLKDIYHIPIYACREETEMLADPQLNMSVHYGEAVSLQADYLLTDLDVLDLAGFSIQMLHTPGHTKGSCCYYFKDEETLFSGDTLFCGSVGRTDFPGGSTAAIVQSLHRLLESLPEETEVYPGHMMSTTIGHEKRYNPFV